MRFREAKLPPLETKLFRAFMVALLVFILWTCYQACDLYSAGPPKTTFELVQTVVFYLGCLIVSFESTFTISPVVDKVLYRAYFSCMIYWFGSMILDLVFGGRFS